MQVANGCTGCAARSVVVCTHQGLSTHWHRDMAGYGDTAGCRADASADADAYIDASAMPAPQPWAQLPEDQVHASQWLLAGGSGSYSSMGITLHCPTHPPATRGGHEEGLISKSLLVGKSLSFISLFSVNFLQLFKVISL